MLYISKAMIVAAYRDKLRALSRRADVTALIPAQWGAHQVEPLDGEVPTVLRRRPLLHGHNHLHVYPQAARVLADAQPDLVHIDEEPYSAVTFQFVRLCRRSGIPCVFFAWQNLDKRLPRPFEILRAYVLRNVAGAIAGTEDAAAVLRRAGYAGPLAVIPQFGVDARRFAPDPGARRSVRQRLGIADHDFVVGFGGRLVAEKGVHLLVESLASLNRSAGKGGVAAGSGATAAGAAGADAVREGARARLLVLGDGPERARLERQAKRLGMAERVHFAGRVPSLAMGQWLPACDIVALPSLRRPGWVEQFGRLLVEAMACGLPVVGSSSGEIPRVIGEAGRVVPAGDGRRLTEALSALAHEPAERARLGRLARERVLALYTHDCVAEQTLAFYRQMLAKWSRP